MRSLPESNTLKPMLKATACCAYCVRIIVINKLVKSGESGENCQLSWIFVTIMPCSCGILWTHYRGETPRTPARDIDTGKHLKLLKSGIIGRNVMIFSSD